LRRLHSVQASVIFSLTPVFATFVFLRPVDGARR